MTFALLKTFLRLCQPAMDHGSRLLFFRAEIEIAGRNCQAGFFTHGGQNHDLRVKSQILDHPLDDYGLLRVLLAKESKVRAHSIKENCYDSGDAAKMARPRFTFEGFGKTADVYVGGKAFGIHLCGGGAKI